MSSLEIIFATIGVILTILTILVAVISVFVQVVTGMFPLSYIEEKRKQKVLNEKFSRGPYDKATIARSTKYYIYPKCSNIDPAQEQEIRHALMATRESLFDKVDQFLDSDVDISRRHLLILADSGMGKTSFVLNYYFHNTRRSKKMRHQLVIIPLGIKNPDELISQIPDQEEKMLFLDAFDEDLEAIKDHRERIILLMEKCKKFKKIIITCRTQFFPKGEEIPVETGILKLGPRSAGDKGVYEFWKLYLSPFDDKDVENYIKKRYPIWRNKNRKEALKIALQIPLLSIRPMLLAYIPDILANGTKINLASQLYEIMIAAWLERESYWVNKQMLREFSEKLAVNIYLNRNTRGTEGVPYTELPELAAEWKIELKPWQLGGRSLLNRDAANNYKFAHRSIMEYLFIARIIKSRQILNHINLTDQMVLFLIEAIEKKRNILPGILRTPGKYSVEFRTDNGEILNTRWGSLSLAKDYFVKMFQEIDKVALKQVEEKIIFEIKGYKELLKFFSDYTKRQKSVFTRLTVSDEFYERAQVYVDYFSTKKEFFESIQSEVAALKNEKNSQTLGSTHDIVDKLFTEINYTSEVICFNLKLSTKLVICPREVNGIKDVLICIGE